MKKKETEVILQRIDNWYKRLPGLFVYDNQNFNDRLKKIELFLIRIYEFKDFSCSAGVLKKQLEKLSKLL